jgi:hypothetical protein
VADDNALRQRRKRAHACGDHHLCRHRVDPRPVASLVPAGADLDPLAELQALAARLVAVHEADPGNVAAAKELRQVLTVIPPVEAAGPLDAIRERVWQKRRLGWTSDDTELQGLAAELAGPAPLDFLQRLSDEVP